MARKRNTIPKGIVLPFRRSGSDGIVAVDGPQVVSTQIKIVVGTLCAGPMNNGALSYNQSLGTLINQLRHSGATDNTLLNLATTFLADKIKEHVKRARVTNIKYTPEPHKNKVNVSITFNALDRPNGRTVAKDVTESISI